MYMNDEEPEFGGRPMGVMGGEEEEESSDEEPYTPEVRMHLCKSSDSPSTDFKGKEEEEESSDEEPHTPEARTQWLIHHSCLSFMPIK